MSTDPARRVARVKICGLTRPEDAARAADLGAWACGMILSKKGPRALDRKQAEAVRRAVPKGVEAVGVFVDEGYGTVQETAAELELGIVQLHGAETEADVVGIQVDSDPVVSVVKTVGVTPDLPLDWLAEYVASFRMAWAILFDSKIGDHTGGTGRTFPWQPLQDPRLRAAIPHGRVILAGGLTARNVPLALEQVKPYALDVSSGVESSPGIKDPVKLAQFFEAVRDWENET